MAYKGTIELDIDAMISLVCDIASDIINKDSATAIMDLCAVARDVDQPLARRESALRRVTEATANVPWELLESDD